MILKNYSKGFTLIELLVVITIIGILATGAVTTFTSQIQKARDTTRISDIKALQGGVEQYYQDAATYPNWLDDWTGTSDTAVIDYVRTLAEDPKHGETCNSSRCWYSYNVGPDAVGIGDGSYELSTAFENEWNRTNRADWAVDNWDDDNRLEVWLLKTWPTNADIDTVRAQATAFSWNAATNSTAEIIILRGAIQAP